MGNKQATQAVMEENDDFEICEDTGLDQTLRDWSIVWAMKFWIDQVLQHPVLIDSLWSGTIADNIQWSSSNYAEVRDVIRKFRLFLENILNDEKQLKKWRSRLGDHEEEMRALVSLHRYISTCKITPLLYEAAQQLRRLLRFVVMGLKPSRYCPASDTQSDVDYSPNIYYASGYNQSQTKCLFEVSKNFQIQPPLQALAGMIKLSPTQRQGLQEELFLEFPSQLQVFTTRNRSTGTGSMGMGASKQAKKSAKKKVTKSVKKKLKKSANKKVTKSVKKRVI